MVSVSSSRVVDLSWFDHETAHCRRQSDDDNSFAVGLLLHRVVGCVTQILVMGCEVALGSLESFHWNMALYEFSIHDLIANDPRWNTVWTEFLSSCTTPSLPLIHHNYQEYNRNKTSPPRIWRDNLLEIWLKMRRRFFHQRRRRRRGRVPGGRQNEDAEQQIRMEDDDDDDGWYPSDGKYSRRYDGENHHITKALQQLSSIFNEPMIAHRGNFYYPPNGYREWHTNQYDPLGWRLYLVHTIPTSCAIFRYRLPHTSENEIVDCFDHDGVLRLFYVDRGEEALWHCIVSEGHRWSLGVRLNEQSAQRLLAMVPRGDGEERRREEGEGVAER